jgi:hypothetical protein
MIHKLMLTIVLATGALVPLNGIGAARLTAQERSRIPYGQRYWVQFRQPQWQEQTFFSPAEMDNFVRTQERNGWDVQVANLRGGAYSVRFRLVHWGGSRVVDSLAEARDWAAYLESKGYEPRIVDYP